MTGLTGLRRLPYHPRRFDTTFNVDTDFHAFGDAFVTKLNASGSALVYSTFLGGTRWRYRHGHRGGRKGSAYVTGYTNSSDYPTTPGAFDTTLRRRSGRLRDEAQCLGLGA